MARPKLKNAKRDKTTGRSRGLLADNVIEVAFRNRVKRVGSAAVVVDERTGARRANERSGYSLGILRLWGNINEKQFDAGEWYAGMIHRYCSLRGLPLPVPKSASMMLIGGGGGSGPDKDADDVAHVRRQHADARRRLLEAGAETGVGSRVNAVTFEVCIEDRAPETLSVVDIGNLRVGLNALCRVTS